MWRRAWWGQAASEDSWEKSRAFLLLQKKELSPNCKVSKIWVLRQFSLHLDLDLSSWPHSSVFPGKYLNQFKKWIIPWILMGHPAMFLIIEIRSSGPKVRKLLAWQCKYPPAFNQNTGKASSELVHKHPSGWKLELDIHLFKVFIYKPGRQMPDCG